MQNTKLSLANGFLEYLRYILENGNMPYPRVAYTHSVVHVQDHKFALESLKATTKNSIERRHSGILMSIYS